MAAQEAFAECVSLSQITLRSNRIGDAGAAWAAEFFSSNVVVVNASNVCAKAHHISLHLPQCVNLEEWDGLG